MGKMIIKNLTDIPDIEVMNIVVKVIQMGRISNDGKQFCYLTVFNINNEAYCISTDLRKCSDVFTFYKEKEYNDGKRIC